MAARGVRSLLFNLSPYDFRTVLGTTLLLGLVSLVASFRPAWRAARISPSDALRME
jgi:putative ABC transport system permease protein